MSIAKIFRFSFSIFLVGCTAKTPPIARSDHAISQATTIQSNEAAKTEIDQSQKVAVIAQAQAIIDSWSRQGMYLPTPDQVAVFQENIDAATPLLAKAIADDNPDVRMRAAFVMERCRVPNKTFANLLVKCADSDKNQLVRIYAYDALCVHGKMSENTVPVLEKRWNALDKNAIGFGLFSDYPDAGEAVFIAGALSANEPDEAAMQPFVNYVLKWLKPAPADLPSIRSAAYSDMRWDALAALRSMPPTPEAIPLLKAILQEKDPPPWMALQVNATLKMQTAHPPPFRILDPINKYRAKLEQHSAGKPTGYTGVTSSPSQNSTPAVAQRP